MRNSLSAGAIGGLAFAVLLGAVMLPQSPIAGLKLAYIDSQAIISAYPGTAEAQATFNAENATWERRAQDLQTEIQNLTNEIERSSMATTQERKNQMNADLQRKSLAYQQFVNSVWGQDGQAYQRNQELMKPIIDKVNALLEKVGTDEGYDFILDAATGTIVHAAPKYDLTPKIIEMMKSGDEPDSE